MVRLVIQFWVMVAIVIIIRKVILPVPRIGIQPRTSVGCFNAPNVVKLIQETLSMGINATNNLLWSPKCVLMQKQLTNVKSQLH